MHERGESTGTDARFYPINVDEAIKVQGIWSCMPFLQRQVLLAAYPQSKRGGVRIAANRLGVSESLYLAALSRACQRVRVGLEG